MAKAMRAMKAMKAMKKSMVAKRGPRRALRILRCSVPVNGKSAQGKARYKKANVYYWESKENLIQERKRRAAARLKVLAREARLPWFWALVFDYVE